MQKTEYFETNSEGEQVLSSDDDTAVEVQNDGVRLTVDVVSSNSDSKVHTYDTTEGFYRISPSDEPNLASELDSFFRILSRQFGPGQITRNPNDSYELVVKKEQVQPDNESGSIKSRTNGEYTISPTANHDALVMLDEILDELTT